MPLNVEAEKAKLHAAFDASIASIKRTLEKNGGESPLQARDILDEMMNIELLRTALMILFVDGASYGHQNAQTGTLKTIESVFKG